MHVHICVRAYTYTRYLLIFWVRSPGTAELRPLLKISQGYSHVWAGLHSYLEVRLGKLIEIVGRIPFLASVGQESWHLTEDWRLPQVLEATCTFLSCGPFQRQFIIWLLDSLRSAEGVSRQSVKAEPIK